MFEGLKNGKTALFLDYSNIFFMQYTIGRRFNLDKFFDELIKDNQIQKVFFFGAYNKDNLSQMNGVEKFKNKYIGKDKFKIFFKELRMKGGKNKGNVDTEMGFEISRQLDSFDTMLLFSGDGDFYSIIKTLIQEYNKKVFILSTAKHTGGELFELTREINDYSKFKILDINSDKEPLTRELKKTIRGELFLYSELIKYYKSISKEELERNIEYIQDLIQGALLKKQVGLINIKPDIPNDMIFRLKNGNNEYIWSIVKKRKIEDKERIVYYLKTIK